MAFCAKNKSLTHDDNDAKDEGDEDRGEQADHHRRCQPGGRGGGGGLRGRREGRRWDLNGKLNSGKNKLGIPLTQFVKQSRAVTGQLGRQLIGRRRSKKGGFLSFPPLLGHPHLIFFVHREDGGARGGVAHQEG